MRNFLIAIFVLASVSLQAAPEKKSRLPAGMGETCESEMSQDLGELAYLLNIQNVLKKSRYEKMMNDTVNAKDCDAVNKIVLIAIGDCTLTDRKKKNCR